MSTTVFFVFGADDPLGAEDRIDFALGVFNSAHETPNGYSKAKVIISTLLDSPDDIDGVPVYMIPSSDFLPDMLVLSNDSEPPRVVNLNSEYGESRGHPPFGGMRGGVEVATLDELMKTIFGDFYQPPDAAEDQVPDPAPAEDGTIPQNGADVPF